MPIHQRSSSRSCERFLTIFKNRSMNLDELELVSQWVDINKKLEAGWAPYRELAGQREEIEKKVVFLKNKGVSPYPRKPPSSDPLLISSSTVLEAPKPPKKKPRTEEKKGKGKSQQEIEKKLVNLKEKGGSAETSRSEIGMNIDDSQNFAKN